MGDTQYLQGTVLNEEIECSLAEICRLCGVTAEQIHEMVEEGVISPQGLSPRKWHFTTIEIIRVQTAVRLQKDLQINLPGCALVLDLIEELEELRLLKRRLT
jgi:chaperone modulatory protein CbpM